MDSAKNIIYESMNTFMKKVSNFNIYLSYKNHFYDCLLNHSSWFPNFLAFFFFFNRSNTKIKKQQFGVQIFHW